MQRFPNLVRWKDEISKYLERKKDEAFKPGASTIILQNLDTFLIFIAYSRHTNMLYTYIALEMTISLKNRK